ncbi:MAG: hypothetical protein U1F87_04600 [Kiritimatiellia bacterium]
MLIAGHSRHELPKRSPWQVSSAPEDGGNTFGVRKKDPAAIDEAIDYIRAHPETAIACYVKYCDVPEAVAKQLPVLHYWKSNEADLQVYAEDFANLLQRGALRSPSKVSALYPSP